MRKISRLKGRKVLSLERYSLTEEGTEEALHYPFKDNYIKVIRCLYKSNDPLNVLQIQTRTHLPIPKINEHLGQGVQKGYVKIT